MAAFLLAREYNARMNRRGWALVALLLASGCAGGSGGYGDDSSSGTPTPGGSSTPTPSGALYGGYVSLSRIRIDSPSGTTDTATATAAFYEPFTLPAVPTPALDTCAVTTPGAAPTPAAFTSRDAGADVQITGPAS